MYRYGLFHAYPILTETQWGNTLGWVATSLPASSPSHYRHMKLVSTEYFYSFIRVFLVIVLLKQALTISCIILLQTAEGLGRTLE